ncbi:hypothetical protein PPL_06918 [Heterostelium album PN500]|uniref:Glutathione S-transferase n=1 Tax=Heterostelium pallidum (strain ATCC 26659 / Pp 5 / PN500) TaxID=670386 RepID=D3BDW5_HETP5|nr:hypothetical protein PPL_06918 [Heterostelium album PN500]EFA80096.1 hypothetical protein PPL_06918 [Heterostelium album PN500]|eukprot:XP_020432216.1 hypothetical protein PPL_06918 [Heterostelium album PN500]
MESTPSIELYGTGSPNVHKITLALEEMNIPFIFHKVNIRAGEQYTETFKKLNPNSKLPALVDHSVGVSIFESGNILQYLATRYGNGKYLPNQNTDLKGHTEVMNWVFWQMAGLGPNFGQFYHFSHYAGEKHEYAIQRFLNETTRLFLVLEKQLASNKFVVGDTYTIADMAIYPWAKYIKLIPELKHEEFPNVYSYIDRVRQIPSVDKVISAVEEDQKQNPPKPPTEEEKKWMFNVDGRSTKA